MGRRFLLIIILMSATLAGWAQYENKFSPSTQMFLSEQRGEIQLPNSKTKVSQTMIPTTPVGASDLAKMKPKNIRPIAEVEQVGGIDMISAFIGLNDNNLSGLEALGVVIQSKFDKLVIALIPVDKIEDVAALDNVTKIEVAEVLEVSNDKQREATQAGDAITNSAAAQALGLTKQYTGKGVILGIVDTGIDFQHVAFKDKNGNSRIVRAYKLSGSNSTSLTTYSSASQISGLTYDTNTEDHGTHTSTTAGGSSVIVNGNNVMVTDDHANATYGGMAPEADLVIAGLSSLYTTSIGTAIQNICNYADQVGKPCVISLSLGSQQGPHDGTGSISSIISQCAGNNHIIVYAAANDAMRADYFIQAGTSNGGGMYASGTASNSKPLLANLQKAWTNADGNIQLYASTINAYARTAGTAISLKFRIVDTTTGDVVYSSSAYSNSTTISMTGSSGLAQYFKSQSGYYNPYGDNATIRVIRGQDSNSNKYYFTIYTPVLVSTSYDDNDGDGVYNSKYALCVSFYPTSGSTIVDMWEGYGVNWFGNDLKLSSSAANSYNLVKGNDDCSIADDACHAKVISVGAYVTKNAITDYAGTTHDWSEDYPNIGDHASFSSYQAAGAGPLGTALPTINAPGARIVAGINSYHTKSVDEDYSYWGDNFISDLVVNNTNHAAYGAMEGTSMATPCVSGIVAQWLQACVEAGKTPTPDYIKEVMSATWDTDQWTNGTGQGAHGAKTFGTHGKINAIKGIQYILGVSAEPSITATPTEVTFEGYATQTYTQTVTVKGMNLEGNISVAKSGDAAFTVDKTNITQSGGTAQADITITWKPTAAGIQTGTITLSSKNAEAVTISLSGTAEAATPTIIVDKEELSFTALPGNNVSQTMKVTGRFLTKNVTATLTDANGVFSVDKTDFQVTADGVDVTISFNSAVEGTYSGQLLLASEGAASLTIALSATAREGGTASDPFLNIAQYTTIDEAGWNTSLVDNLYKYTEYEDDEVAWLTLPVYGAFVGAKYAQGSTTFGSGKTQMWVESSLGNNNTYAGTTWTESDLFSGSPYYFTNANARAMGFNSGSNTEVRTVSFYVTNTTAVKLYGTNRNEVSATYPASLNIYECSMNGDGSLAPVATATKSVTSATSGTYNIAAEGLEVGKIYKVDASIYRGYMYEIGFQTPITVEKIPTIKAEPTELTFESIYATTEATKSFTVRGKYLEDKVTLTVNDEHNAFSVNKNEISVEEATAGTEIVVTFHPAEAGTFSATLTLASEGAEPVTIMLNGTAEAATPTIIADKSELSFSAGIDIDQSQTFTVTGRFIQSDITLTLSDANHVFSVNPATLTAEQMAEEAEVTVTFNSFEEGTFTGTLTLASEGAEPVVINLSATANNGGTASDSYLNIAKYATIDDAGWSTTYVNTLYKYTEYEEDEVAWLTLPIYGAWVGTYYNNHPQKWIESNVNDRNNKYAGATWSSNEKLLGSSSYFTGTNGNGSARAMGYNSRWNSSQETVTFYVTNITAVKLLALGQNQSSNSYPTSLKIYECTVNTDGSVSASTTAVKSDSNSQTSGTFVLSATDLDATKVYKVETGTYRSYIAEIGFQTPLVKKVLIGDVNRDGFVNIADVTAMVDIILGKDNEEPYAYDHVAADIDGDNDITITDVTALVNIILSTSVE